MAIKFLHNLDLGQNQLLSALFQNENEAPASPKDGQVYFNTNDNRVYVYAGSVKKWVGMDALDAVMDGSDIIDQINEELAKQIALARVDVDVFTDEKDGLVPKGSEGTAKFLREDGGWQTPAYASQASDVGLGSVTNDKQVKALSLGSTVDGYVPTWDGANGDKLKPGYEVVSDLSAALGETAKLATAQGIKSYVGSMASAADAMRYVGAIDASTNPSFPASPKKGDTHKISVAGTIGGIVVEAGDMIIALADKTGATVAADWNVIQANIDGAVIGPASATNGNFAAFGASPTSIVDSGKKAADFAASNHNHNAVYPQMVAANLTASTSQLVTHNFGTRDVICKVYQTTSPYSEVMVDIEHTSTSQVTVKFAQAPAANAYRIVIMGVQVTP